MKICTFAILCSLNFKGTKLRDCGQKFSEDLFASWCNFSVVENWFGRFCQGDFNLRDQPRSGQLSDVDEDVLLTTVENKSNISTEEIAMSLKIDSSNYFSLFKKKQRPILANPKVVIFDQDNARRIHRILLTLLFQTFICSCLYRIILLTKK